MIPQQLVSMHANYLFWDVILLPFAIGLIFLLRRKLLAGIPRTYPFSAGFLRQLVTGIVLAVAGLLLVIVPSWILGSYAAGAAGFHEFHYMISAPQAGTWLYLGWLFILQSLWEELLFRCFGVALLAWLFYWLAGLIAGGRPEPAALWNRWIACGIAASIVVSGGFAFVHSHNSHVSPLALANIALAGMVLGLLFINYANVIGAWAFHFAWNFGLVLLGLPVSGLAIASSQTGISGSAPGIISGGQFGPEGSVIATVVLSAAVVWLIHDATRRTTDESPSDEAPDSDEALAT